MVKRFSQLNLFSLSLHLKSDISHANYLWHAEYTETVEMRANLPSFENLGDKNFSSSGSKAP